MTIRCTLTRSGVLMRPEPGNAFEVEGVLNPAAGRTPDGELHLLPRLVAAGNVSRIGLARIEVRDGVPAWVQRQGIALAPEEGWERGRHHSGVEDPRVTFIAALGLNVMTYVAYGPFGPRPALAVSFNLRQWQRLGPLHFEYQASLDADLNLFSNKDTVFFPRPVPGPDGDLSYAMLHRPMWDLGQVRTGEGVRLPAGVADERPGIWVSFVPVAEVERNLGNLVHLRHHRLVALPEYAFEALKIGAGPPPLWTRDGWLVIHHGVTGEQPEGFDPTKQRVTYAAGALLLDADDVTKVLDRTPEPLLSPQTEDERVGTVANVVFPTAIEEIEGVHYVFYGMADAKIGVARLDGA
ncbi:glycosidase [Kribbella shirazensis]|uniref:Putative GH43/DUF377 family glycosyl hydrolase n=1 Tax=Kribbella shirazensis TaxID=1105143 RepID=A0A7X5VHI9_9ACTN|nr:glycosidase [Kribbella shirazensis]NIK61315.1 putative GH43/DUF377 family glycosyl hydrolase [Kribbella shirazensis]